MTRHDRQEDGYGGGAGEDGRRCPGASRTRLEGRISDLQAMAAQHPLVAALVREAPLGAAVLEDLEQGPGADVRTPLVGGALRPWTDL